VIVAKAPNLEIKKVPTDTRVTFDITVHREMIFRLALAGGLLRVAAWILGTRWADIDVTVKGLDDND
jgi:hypothetical protein